MKLTRAYNLALYANPVKLDTARYTYERHLRLVNIWAGKLFFNGNKPLSTAGMGTLANQAQHKARGIIAALKAAQSATGDKANVPQVKKVGCPAKIEASHNSFDYWLTVENEFEKQKRVSLPVKSHGKLNAALKEGWALKAAGEFFKARNGRFYTRVFVQKEVARAKPQRECLGVDVGYRHGACRSDGHIGTNTGKAIKASREKKAQRQRQGLKVSGPKTRIKQLLDREAKLAIARCERDSRSLAVESPKVMGRLCGRSLHGWASAYFANRCEVLARERGVWLAWVNPSYSSQTCAQCSHKDKRNREGISFVCTRCGHSAHADVNAARNISRWGADSLSMVLKRSGTVKRIVA